jgi:hypothetical protein
MLYPSYFPLACLAFYTADGNSKSVLNSFNFFFPWWDWGLNSEFCDCKTGAVLFEPLCWSDLNSFVGYVFPVW